ncbi:hypothetical protein ATANTOWER_027656 [Ataeniobius toweri]|uniref:TIMELESS-interacting protein n=1 Tax=Ataeniobius toweri TaxID=208326 RepID=A0ABU7C6Y1_9TELE|nr:hypothetical protein [Ataeniobius toweri]
MRAEGANQSSSSPAVLFPSAHQQDSVAMYDPQEDGMSDDPDLDNMEDEAFPPLPPPHSPGEGGAQTHGDPFGDAEEGEVSKLADVPAAKRKVVKRPQPKLDSQRLISERGLPALRTLFDNVRFKGKGHEAEDLRLLMQKMENWAHRLYPKLQFEDFVERVEKLGSKKEVQTCLKRIRLDMPMTYEDFMDKEGVEEPPPDSQGFEDPDPFNNTSFNDPQGPIHSTPAPVAPAPPSLTEEQRMRMELNRQRALERRLARQQQTDPSDSQEVTAPSSGDDPSSVSTANVLNGSAEQEEKLEEPDLSSSTQLSIHPSPTEPEPTAEPQTHLPVELPADHSVLSGSADQEENPGEHLDPDLSSSKQSLTPSEPPIELQAHLPSEVPAELPVHPSAESTQGEEESSGTNELPVLSSSAEQEEKLEDLDLNRSTSTPPSIHPSPTEPGPPAELPDEPPAEDKKENNSGPPLGNILEEGNGP